MIDDLAPLVSRLPDPTPPPTLAATVMARIARDADRQRAAAGAGLAPARHHRDRPAWMWTLAGLAAVLCATAYGWLVEGMAPDLVSPRIGGGSPALMPMEGPAGLLVAVGLLVYLAGLFAPLRSGGRR